MGRPRLAWWWRRRFWRAVRRGLTASEAAVAAGVSEASGKRWFVEAGGVIPAYAAEPSGRYLSFDEREEIARLRAAGYGVRQIASRLERSPSTISRELRRYRVSARGYKASMAQTDADDKARRPKPAKLASDLRLRREVQGRLEHEHSPEQISKRLCVDYPEDQEMRVSHEAIYQSLYVQGRGGLKRELAKHLRTGRTVRKPRRRADQRRTRTMDMVSISERPAEVADRAVPGHWEGDLILGSTASGSAIGTLVELVTGFVLLLHLPEDHGALALQQAMVTKMSQLPEQLRRTLTWDQGSEMANHAQIAAAADLNIYFADPHSPWQRPSNENTNGLLRQYFPKGTDLSVYGAGYLDYVAAELNNRPRKRLNWKTPAENLDELLSNPPNPTGVATTA